MERILTFSLIVAFFFMSSMSAQSIQGRATYKTQRKVEIKLDSSRVADGMQEQLHAMLKKQFEREYTLEFNQNESLYKEIEKLDKPTTASNMGMQLEIIGSGAGDVLYKNKKKGVYTNQTESFSKVFLIKDSIKTRDWKLEQETKNIGEYTCFKATYTYERRELTAVGANADKHQSNDGHLENRKENVLVTAWYTPQIPVQLGPSEYDGLPGLILEISDDKLTILCSRIVLNPSKELEIIEPKGGKKISEKDYDAIIEKKMEEVSEQFHGNHRENDHDFEIRIGG